MIAKHFLPAFVALGSAAAQSTNCSPSGGTITINSAGDATQLASCRTVKGSVSILASGTVTIPNGLTTIEGDLRIDNNANLQQFSAESLQSITGTFSLTNVTTLASLSLPALNDVKSITWTTCPALDTLNFGEGINKVDTLIVADTFVSDLSAVGLDVAQSININNNRRLTQFSTSLSSIKGSLDISSNGINLTLNMPNVKWINILNVANVTGFTAPSLAAINKTANLYFNYFTEFGSTNLTTVGADLAFVGNSELTRLTFPALTTIGGGLTIANNTELVRVDGFGSLSKMGGAGRLMGSFDTVDFPALKDVQGGFDVSSTKNIDTICNNFRKLGSSKVIQGTVSCSSNNANANNETGTASSGSQSGSGANHDNLASGVLTNTGLMGIAFFIALGLW